MSHEILKPTCHTSGSLPSSWGSSSLSSSGPVEREGSGQKGKGPSRVPGFITLSAGTTEVLIKYGEVNDTLLLYPIFKNAFLRIFFNMPFLLGLFYFCFCFCFFWSFCPLGPHPQHLEVPKQGVESEL